MTTLYMIRHAEAEGNLYRIAQGQHESSLTDRGWRQVQALQERFLSLSVDAVYSSDLYRARATACAISRPRKLPLYNVRELREICVGEWEGHTWGEISRRDPLKMKQFSQDMEHWYIRGAESPAAVLERVKNAVTRIAALHDGQNVAVVSHGYAIRLLLGNLEGYTLAQTGQTLHGDNTAVSVLEARDGKLHLVSRDDNSHLRTPEFLSREKPVHPHNALEPGLWFTPPDVQSKTFETMAREALQESGILQTEFSLERLIMDAQKRWTVEGYSGTDSPPEAAGFLQLGPEPGWISLLHVRREARHRGYGMQLLGQAVQHTRRHGGNALYAAVQDNTGAVFFRDNGFLPDGTTADGRTVWKKSIAFPELNNPGGEFFMDIQTGRYVPFSGISGVPGRNDVSGA